MMKKGFYLLATAVLLVACNNRNQYAVTANIEGVQEGSTAYLLTEQNHKYVKLDSSIVKAGTFTFQGRQDSTIVCHFSCNTGKGNVAIDFFLENGQINIQLTTDNHIATGTPNNDIYQAIRQQLNDLNKQMFITYESMSDTVLTDEQREAKAKEMEVLDKKMVEVTNAAITQNITNAVGIYLLKRNFYNMSVEELDPLITKIPAEFLPRLPCPQHIRPRPRHPLL